VRIKPRRDLWVVEGVALIGEIIAAAERLGAARDADGALIRRTDAQWRMLRVVGDAWGRLSISDVGRKLRISRQAAHNVVVAAARHGLVELDTNRHDRRLVQVELTREGRTELAAAAACERAWAITLLNGLAVRDMRATTHILRVIRQRLVRDERTRKMP
jgi:DNA-binding MarR family transcriptional regulator